MDLLDSIAETDVFEEDFMCHFTTTLSLVMCAGHDWETILPVSLNRKNMTTYLTTSTHHGTSRVFTPLSWWGHVMSVSKLPTRGLGSRKLSGWFPVTPAAQQEAR